MRWLLLTAILLGSSSQSNQAETTVLNSAPTLLNRASSYSGSSEVCNYGANVENCQTGKNPQDGGCPVAPDGGALTSLGHGKQIASGGCWANPYGGSTNICCIAATADQVDGGGTVVSEGP